jgi:hypothetical protein
MRTRFVCRGRAVAGALAATAMLGGVGGATALAASSKTLPVTGKATNCSGTLFKVSGRLPVHAAFAAAKGAHPAKALLSCANANAVAKAGKADYSAPPFKVGKTVKVKGVTYTLGRGTSVGGMPASGPIYGWSGGGVVIYLINPTGA